MQPRFPESGVQPKTREIYDVFAILVRNGTKIQKETYKCQQSPQNRFFAKNLRNFRFFAFPCPIHDQNLIWSQNRKKKHKCNQVPQNIVFIQKPEKFTFFYDRHPPSHKVLPLSQPRSQVYPKPNQNKKKTQNHIQTKKKSYTKPYSKEIIFKT